MSDFKLNNEQMAAILALIVMCPFLPVRAVVRQRF